MIANITANHKAMAAAVLALWVLTGLGISQEALFPIRFRIARCLLFKKPSAKGTCRECDGASWLEG